MLVAVFVAVSVTVVAIHASPIGESLYECSCLFTVHTLVYCIC